MIKTLIEPIENYFLIRRVQKLVDKNNDDIRDNVDVGADFQEIRKFEKMLLQEGFKGHRISGNTGFTTVGTKGDLMVSLHVGLNYQISCGDAKTYSGFRYVIKTIEKNYNISEGFGGRKYLDIEKIASYLKESKTDHFDNKRLCGSAHC